MIDLRFRPIDQWPGKRNPKPRRAQFRAKYLDTLNRLEYELKLLAAREIIIQAGFGLEDIRYDGWPRSTARPARPGVLLSFKSKGNALSFPCDTYDTWEDNLRAIALALEALRAVDRYGVTKGFEQYRGFVALEAPKQVSADAAAAMIANFSGAFTSDQILLDSNCARRAYISAAKIAHPDKGGTAEWWDTLQKSKAALDLHFGRSL